MPAYSPLGAFPLSRRALLAGGAALGALAAAGGARAQDPSLSLDVPYVPTPQQVVDRMLELAKVSGKDFVMDLGCGDGRMLVAAAVKFGARGFGVDLNPQRIAEARENARKANVADKVSFDVKNLFETSIKDADVLTMYLLPSVNLQLRPRILDEMKPGSRIVSHAFNMGEWQPDVAENVDGRNVYFWIVPAKLDGAWTIKDGARTIRVELKQAFQRLEGSAAVGGKSGKAQGRMVGADMALTVEIDGQTTLYAGRLRADGALAPIAGEGARGWSAARG
jgi:SAM-dependent methyltransferase